MALITIKSFIVNSHLIIPDSHAHPNHHNKRAEWLGDLICDLKPDIVIHIGDSADMPSLSSYDRGKKIFQGRSYRNDIDSHLDFNDRLWNKVKKQKKKLPKRIFCIGNHEERIERVIQTSPELDGAIGYHDLELEKYYDQIIPYNGGTPGSIMVDGVYYAHYFVSGVKGLPLGGEHPAYSLLTKRFSSHTCGHSHLADLCYRSLPNGKKIQGCVVGCYQDYDSDWAGEVNNLWWRGVVYKKNVEYGMYDPSFISLDSLKKEYA